jgi:Nop53 (60S ribosomal biogenesis)
MSAVSNPYHGCGRNKARDRLACRPVQSVRYKWLSRLKFYELGLAHAGISTFRRILDICSRAFLPWTSQTYFKNCLIAARAEMSISKAAPQQFKQPSRKGKKAWRKNVDITDVQSGLERLQEEIIQG